MAVHTLAMKAVWTVTKQDILVALLLTLYSPSSICCIACWVSWSKGCLHGAAAASSPRSGSLPCFHSEPCMRCHGHQWTSLAQAFWFKNFMLAWASLVAQTVKDLPTMQEIWVWFLSWEDPLEKEMAIHSSILARRIPWTEKPGWLQAMGSQRVRHERATNTHMLAYLANICETIAPHTTNSPIKHAHHRVVSMHPPLQHSQTPSWLPSGNFWLQTLAHGAFHVMTSFTWTRSIIHWINMPCSMPSSWYSGLQKLPWLSSSSVHPTSHQAQHSAITLYLRAIMQVVRSLLHPFLHAPGVITEHPPGTRNWGGTEEAKMNSTWRL